MKTSLISLLFIIFISGPLDTQNTEVIKFEKLDALIKEKGDQIKIINFWATWCAPCIKELPYFEKVRENYGDELEVNLISLDFADQISRVNKFVERKKLKSNIYLLDETDYNSWIDRVDKSWSGAIPATLIINESSGDRIFVESELKEGELEELIKKMQTK